MTTKLTVALWKWGKRCVKEKREKEKNCFHFPFPVFGWTVKMRKDTSHFLTSTQFLESKQPRIPNLCELLLYELSNSEGRKLTEFISFDAKAWVDLSGTSTSSAPATTKTGTCSTDFSSAAASCGERTIANDNRPISCSASSHPSTCNGAWNQGINVN